LPGNTDKYKGLRGTWWRVPEQDEPGSIVFRKDGVDLPPARGRRGFTLHEDGRATVHGPGPDDRRQSTDTHWQIDPAGKLHVQGFSDATAEIADFSGDTLKLKR
jgi:hypothetical protein